MINLKCILSMVSFPYTSQYVSSNLTIIQIVTFVTNVDLLYLLYKKA